MNRVFTTDGPGVVTDFDRRQGTTWLHVESAGFSGWYPSHEVTADIGDGDVTNPSDFPAPNKGTKLPYNPKPRDVFHDELNIQPIHDLPENLDPTNSIDSIRNYEPNAVFGSSHPFGKERHARHFAVDHDTEAGDEDLDLDFDHVPSDWKDKNPGLDDYGPDYDAKNPVVVNPQDGWVRDQGGKFHHQVKNAADDDINVGDRVRIDAMKDVVGIPIQEDSPVGWVDEIDGDKVLVDVHGGQTYEVYLKDVRKVQPWETSSRHAEFTEDGPPDGWNDIASPSELDHPFKREPNDDDEDLHTEAGAADTLKHIWWGSDYDWLNGSDDQKNDDQKKERGRSKQTTSAEHSAAGLDALNDSGEENASLGDLMNPSEQVPWDPSHGVTPGGDMQVYSPDQPQPQQLGQPQQPGQPGGVADKLHNAIGGGDGLEGVEVPHAPDGDDELAGIPVPHQQGPGQLMGDPTQMGQQEQDPAMDSQQMGTGNMSVNPQGLYAADDQIAAMAANFLARTAGKEYSDAEQNYLMHENGVASQLNSLNLVGSIYEDDDDGSFLAL